MRKTVHPATWAAHAGGAKDQQSAGVVPPIQPATTFLRDTDYALENDSNMYQRPHSETVRHVEKVIAHLEGAAESLLFPSGMAAVSASLRWVPNGGRIVLQKGIYWGTTKWIRDFCARRSIDLVEVDATDLAALADGCGGKADAVFIETPSNPLLKVIDIAGAAEVAHAAGAVLIVDNTVGTPILCQPLALGADIVMHSATKAMNGHSDVLGGVLSARADVAVWEAITLDRADAGAVMGPFEAWLLLRGLRTLPLRVERMCENAMRVATFLEDHPAVEAVLYPGLPSDPAYDLASRQMQGGYGGLLSVLVKGGKEEALSVAGRLEFFLRATSLGGVESLVEHRYSIESHTGLPENLLRLSVGIESAEDLIADLGQALGQ